MTPGQSINGIDLQRVAGIVSGKPSLMATAEEHRIADAVCKYGEEIERKGYLPHLRRAAMYRRMVELARETPARPLFRSPVEYIDGIARPPTGAQIEAGPYEGPEPAEQDGEE